MRLLYVNEIGSDYKGQKQYEFIFTEQEDIENDLWFIRPAAIVDEPLCPDLNYIDLVGLIKNEDVQFTLIQHSEHFAVIDSVDGIVSLAWEEYDEELHEENERLFFRFGETIESVHNKLNNRGYKLIVEIFTEKELKHEEE